MGENTDAVQPIKEAKLVAEPLAPLPFTYERTTDPAKAQYREWRVSPVVFEGQTNEPIPDEEIIDSVRKQHEAKQWYTQEYWRRKGMPSEQVEFAINGRQITVYNFNRDKLFTDEHVERAKKAFQQLLARFPKVFDEIRWVLIDDVQPPSLLADDYLYPTNGTAMREHRAFRFMPRGTELMPHRVSAVTNFEGTFVHELGHLIQSEFEGEWREKYKWQYCFDHEDEWEVRKAQNGENRWFNKETGEMAPQGQFPLQPEQCVTSYARQNMGEDICDSLVAYVYDPEQLRRVSPDKFGILQGHDLKQTTPDISITKVPKEEIKLPEIKPETVLYFVQEPEATTQV